MMSALAFVFFYLCACGNKSESVDYVYDPNFTPEVYTDSMAMFISSDSGYIEYKVISKTWEMYNKADEPYWLFPDGGYLEKYDSLGVIEATIEADTVWRYVDKGLWKMLGNVFAKTAKGATYASQELFFDENTRRFYSHVVVDIDDPEQGRLTALKGFNANQQLDDFGASKVIKGRVLLSENDFESSPPVQSDSVKKFVVP